LKDEVRYLYKKKEFLNTQLYKAHLQIANMWGPIWDIISDTIHDNLSQDMTTKYHSLDRKLLHLQEIHNTETPTTGNNHSNTEFYPRVINLTDITFSNAESALLQKGFKYNIHPATKQWLKTLALEAETP
jgi:hypothetical protein